MFASFSGYVCMIINSSYFEVVQEYATKSYTVHTCRVCEVEFRHLHLSYEVVSGAAVKLRNKSLRPHWHMQAEGMDDIMTSLRMT